jgi:hypothetical protein
MMEEHGLRTFMSRMLRKTRGSKRDEATGDWR